MTVIINLILTLLVGALIGWIASVLMRTNEQQGAGANILVGIIGSLVGAWFFGSVLGIGAAETAGAFTVAGIFWGIVGAVLLLGLLKMTNILR